MIIASDGSFKSYRVKSLSPFDIHNYLHFRHCGSLRIYSFPLTVKNYSSGVLFFCSYLLNEVINASDKIRHTNGEKPDGGKNLVSSNYQTFIVTLVE